MLYGIRFLYNFDKLLLQFVEENTFKRTVTQQRDVRRKDSQTTTVQNLLKRSNVLWVRF